MLLVRHGQSEWNAARRWQGRSDSPLTSLGRRQVDRCVDVLRRHADGFGALWSSPLGRTVETAAIVSEALELAPVRLDDRLQEADAGDWTGLHIDEIERRYPSWLDTGRRPDSFEPADTVVERTVAALADIADVAVGTSAPVLVITHSGVIRRLVAALGGADERVPNLGGVWVDVDRSPIGDLGRLGAVGVVEAFDAAIDVVRRIDG